MDEDDIETFIRGRFMKVNCDIEYALYGLMMLSSQSFDRLEEFKAMNMHNKIECAIYDLKKYRFSLYEEYKEDLEQLWIFKEFRNKICHRRMVINEDRKTFKFLYFDKHEGKVDGLEETYNVEAILVGILMYDRLVHTITVLNSKLIGITQFPLKGSNIPF